ncbi:MAG: hypothetical protein ACN6O2_05245 [Stenotrophomonas sp.]
MENWRQRGQQGLETLGDKLRLYGRWWVARGWNSPRAWRAIAIGVLALSIVLALFRQPLADWLWPESRIQMLLDAGNKALAQGRLSAEDGSGARELFEAAAALDPDRSDVRQALARTAQAALQRARQALAKGDYAGCEQALQLAHRLQAPSADIDRINQELHGLQRGQGSVEDLLLQAEAAQAQGRLDDGDDSALPLYQQVLAIQPDRMQALEGRDEALADLLMQANRAVENGQLQAAAEGLRRVERYDAGHAELPAAKALLNAALEQHRLQGERALARGRLDAAADAFEQVVAVAEDPAARQGLERVAHLQAQEATRLAGDFQFEQAAHALQRARRLAPDSAEVAAATQTVERIRNARRSMDTGLPAGERERRLKTLLKQLQDAEAREQWLLPPGSSAYDRFKAAQALAPQDPRVKRAAARIQPAARACMEDNLRANRLRAARTCLDAWQALAPGDSSLATARRRLAQRWIAVGSERLGSGDIAFAQQALLQAQEIDAATPEITGFSERVRNALR